MLFKMIVATVAMFAGGSAAQAACWRLPSGQVMQSASNSTPPVAGARQVPCPDAASSIGSVFGRSASPSVVPSNSGSGSQSMGIRAFDQQPDQRECVDYVRSRVSSLPTGLFTFADKTAIINSRRARAGSVAIITVPGGEFAEYGHIAYVEAVTGNSITISETHFGGRYFERRQAVGRDIADAEGQLRIVGYFQP